MPQEGSLPEDLLREIIPADITGLCTLYRVSARLIRQFCVCRVIVSELLRLDHVDKKRRQIQCVGRRPDLVIHHSQLVVVLTDVQHGADEVLPVRSEHPGDANDKEPVCRLDDCLLSVQLALPVHIQRGIVLIIRLPWPRARSVKDVVRGQVDDLRAALFRSACQILRPVHIDGLHNGPFVLILGKVHRSPGGTVHDHIRRKTAHGFPDCLTIGDVQGNIGHRHNACPVLNP